MTTTAPRSAPDVEPDRPMDPNRLRYGTAMLVAGLVAQVPLGALHPHQEYANDSVAAFHEYAHSQAWVLVHLGQFLGLLLVSIGLVAVATTLARKTGAAGIVGLVAAVSALVAAAVFAVQMAVDGVALKAAIDAWESATDATDQAVAYRVAESIRSVEKGLSALFNITNGLTLVSLGVGLTLADNRDRGGGRGLGLHAMHGRLGHLTIGSPTRPTRVSHSTITPAQTPLEVLDVLRLA